MSTVKDIVKALRKVGAVCRKKPREEQYVCYLEDKGRAEIVVDPYNTEIRLLTDEEVTEFYYNFGGEWEDAVRVEEEIQERLGARADIKKMRKGKGLTYSVYVISFNTEEAEPDKIAKIARNIAEKDIWVDIRYRMKIGLRKGEDWFRNEDEFVKELLGEE